MPLHPVGLIVGGTLAVIGSGYAFKKLVYDPHLAQYIEAFLESHPFLLPSPPDTVQTRERRRVAVPVPAYASATGRQPNLTKLRRRSSRSSQGEEDTQMRESLLHGRDRFRDEIRRGGEEFYLDGHGLDARIRSRPGLPTPISTRTSKLTGHDRSDVKRDHMVASPATKSLSNTASGTYPAPRRSTKRRLSDTSRPLVDITEDSPTSPQDAEIRSVIFNYTTPAGSGSRTPIGGTREGNTNLALLCMAPGSSAPSLLHDRIIAAQEREVSVTARATVDDVGYMGESTTFSFLSLSQASSPEMGFKSLAGSWSLGQATSRGGDGWEQFDGRSQFASPSPSRSRVLRSPNIPTISSLSTYPETESVSRVSSPQRSGVTSPTTGGLDLDTVSGSESWAVHPDSTMPVFPEVPAHLPHGTSVHGTATSMDPVGTRGRTGWEFLSTPRPAEPCPSQKAESLSVNHLGMNWVQNPSSVALLSELNSPTGFIVPKGQSAPPSPLQATSPLRRGPMSVVSLSDSEGWEAV